MQQVIGFAAPLVVFMLVLSACGGSSGGGTPPPPSLVPTVTAVDPSSGGVVGGDAVTITGTNFVMGSTTVTFGGVAATAVNVVSATELTCTTPARPAGAADVEATTAEGTGTLAGGYTFEAVIDALFLNRDSSSIVIFKDILAHSGLGGDVILDSAGSGISNPSKMAIWNDWLAVTSRNNNNVLLWNGVSTLTNGQAPDVSLSTSSAPAGAQIVNGDLYVATRNGDQVMIWRDVLTLTSGDPADAVLQMPAGLDCPVEAKVFNDRLYVACRCESASSVLIYDGASTLAGGEAPSAMLDTRNPRRLEFHDNVLWVQSSTDAPAFGFSNPGSLATGAVPDRAIFGMVPSNDRGCFVADGLDAWLGGRYNDDPPLVRVDLTPSLIVTPEATVDRSVLGDEEVYDLAFLADTLVGTQRQGSYAFLYRNPRALATDQSPDKFLFDARMGYTKDVILIER